MVGEVNAFEDERANRWKAAVIDWLVCSFLLNEENASDPQRALRDIVEWEVSVAMDPAVSSVARDAARYQWIKWAGGLQVRSLPRQGAPWTNGDTGERYRPTHDLVAFGVGFSGLPTLDELVDQAMEMFPIDGDGTPQC